MNTSRAMCFALKAALLAIVAVFAILPGRAQTTMLDFGTISVGGTRDEILVKYPFGFNTHTLVTVDFIALTGSDATEFEIVADNMTGHSLYVGQTVSARLRFAPITAGPKHAVFTGACHAVDTDTGEPLPCSFTNVDLNGQATISAARMGLAPRFLDFGHLIVGQARSLRFAIKNVGDAGSTLTGSVGGVTAPFAVVSGGGAFTLTRGHTRWVVVRYAPGATGTFGAAVGVTSNDASLSSTVVPLGGSASP